MAGAVVSTIPADAAAAHLAVLRRAPVLLDAIYDPWPTPLAAAVTEAGGTVIDGLQMLLHQAFAPGRAVRRPARAERSDESGGPAALTSENGGGGLRCCAGVAGGVEHLRRVAAPLRTG